jgi:nanoRNase/pAp phosphatase (c-di-AMP/oligoRNAs hydrolase)
LDEIAIRAVNPVTLDHLHRLREILRDGPVLITTHDNPDPDALAAGKGMSHLLRAMWRIPTELGYRGLVGRAENWAMLNLLTPEWRNLDHAEVDLSKFSALVLVDCQPGSRNSLSSQISLPTVVIDHHHPLSEQTPPPLYADIRLNVGATVTMVYQYLHAAQVQIDPILATAMFYGLRSDTNGLSRGATSDDGLVYVKLLEKLDHQVLLKIETAGLAQEYYRAFYQGIQNARVYGKAIVAHLENMHRPDFPAELADLLFRYERVNAALCSGVYKQVLHFSIRTSVLDQDAGLLVQTVVFPPGKAGGHGTMAGGQIPLSGVSAETLVAKLEKRFLERVGEPDEARPLL